MEWGWEDARGSLRLQALNNSSARVGVGKRTRKVGQRGMRIVSLKICISMEPKIVE